MKQTAPTAILAVYDVSGIQEYIFATSKLRENVGASLIVGQILKEDLPQALTEVLGDKALVHWEQGKEFQLAKLDHIVAEIIYIGGGSAVVAYRTKEPYHTINGVLAKRLLAKSYTLTLAVACVETNFENYGADRLKLAEKLEDVKAGMLRQRPMACLPLVEQEGLTGLPITYQSRYGENLSTVQALKQQAVETYGGKSNLQLSLPGDAAFAVEMEDLISVKGEDSFVAVVHIDGNAMGKELQEKIIKLNDYDQAVREMRCLSQGIAQVYRDVMGDMVWKIYAYVRDLTPERGSSVPEQYILPLRPLILDGDDLTFICKGTLGIPLAAAFLRQLANQWSPLLSFTACAGVALVHSHFPFQLAYEIAESCCLHAKKRRLAQRDQAGYIDFHLNHSFQIRDIKEWREKALGDLHHAWGKKGLLQRPYRVEGQRDLEHRLSFDRLDRLLSCLPGGTGDKAAGEDAWPRRRLKQLFEAYQMGPQQVLLWQRELASRGYELSSLGLEQKLLPEGPGEYEETSLYDALELMDLYERNVFSCFTEPGAQGRGEIDGKQVAGN